MCEESSADAGQQAQLRSACTGDHAAQQQLCIAFHNKPRRSCACIHPLRSCAQLCVLLEHIHSCCLLETSILTFCTARGLRWRGQVGVRSLPAALSLPNPLGAALRWLLSACWTHSVLEKCVATPGCLAASPSPLAATRCLCPSCAAAQLELLEALAETAPRAYLQRGPSGQSLLRELYQQAAEADLAARSAPDDIARLHALFDVALDHGMGGLVRDYLAEVRAAGLGASGNCHAGAGAARAGMTPAAGTRGPLACSTRLGSLPRLIEAYTPQPCPLPPAGLLRPPADLQRPCGGLSAGCRVRAAMGAEAAGGVARPPGRVAGAWAGGGGARRRRRRRQAHGRRAAMQAWPGDRAAWQAQPGQGGRSMPPPNPEPPWLRVCAACIHPAWCPASPPLGALCTCLDPGP